MLIYFQQEFDNDVRIRARYAGNVTPVAELRQHCRRVLLDDVRRRGQRDVIVVIEQELIGSRLVK